MRLPENDFQVLKLTPLFYEAYPLTIHTEILEKNKRAYNCLLFQTHYNYFIAIPFRSEITHKYAFCFRNTKRARFHKSGLDYTKIVIIDKTEYLDTKDAIIDSDEYRETMLNFEKIKGEALAYVEDYVAHLNGVKKIHEKEFRRRYGFSCLKYFHKQLGIESD